MRKLLYFILFTTCLHVSHVHGQNVAGAIVKSGVKSSAKNVGKESLELSAKTVVKNSAVKGSEKAVQQNLSKRVVSKLYLDKMGKLITKKGFKNLYTFANRETASSLKGVGTSALKHKNSGKTTSYAQRIIASARGGKRVAPLNNKSSLHQVGKPETLKKNALKPLAKEAVGEITDRILRLDKIIQNSGSLKEKWAALLKINQELHKMPVDQAKALKKTLSPRTQKSLSRVSLSPKFSNGKWADNAKPGNSMWMPDHNYRPPHKTYNNLDNKTWGEILKPYNVKGIDYIDGVPDLSPFAHSRVNIDYDAVLGPKGWAKGNSKVRQEIQEAAYKAMEKDPALMKKVKEAGCKTVKEYKEKLNLVCHELPGGDVLLVPREIHDNIPSHLGGISSYIHLSEPASASAAATAKTLKNAA